MTPNPKHATGITLLGFCAALLVAGVCYWPATGGEFLLDDRPNLGGLARVSDGASAWDYILSGTAGPSGRPLALATFALQADSYADGARAFIVVNIGIHLLNAVLLAGCLYLVSRLRAIGHRRSLVVAVVAASLWVLMPLLATASLLVVQRMTTLSATFLLLGLGGYLLARRRLDTAPRSALAGMTASVGIGALLAALCKESGVLLPVLVLALELTLLSPPTGLGRRAWRGWQSVVLIAPLALLLVYLASNSSYPEYVIAREGFTGWERLLTQARLLWLYVFKALVGLPGLLGIFQEPPTISRSLFEPLTLLASLAWASLAVGAIAWRRRYPLFAFAVLWFLGGHLLESTVLPVELYFEHRNYLAIVGPVFAIVSGAAAIAPRWWPLSGVAAALYLCSSAFFLYSFASLWGEPSVAARYWATKYPDSVRAVTNLATYQLAEEGPLRTLQTLDRFVIAHPEHAYLRIQELNLLCRVAPEQDHSAVVERLHRGLPGAAFTLTAGTMLAELFSTASRRDCAGVDTDTVKALASRLRENPVYARVGLYGRFHHKLLAGIARYQGDYEATLENLRRAIAYGRTSELNMMMVTALTGAGDFDAAREFIEDAYNRAPRNPVRAAAWRRDLDGLRAYVNELEESLPEKE